MTNQFEVRELQSYESAMLDQLPELLIDVVHGGASIGFIPPLSKEAAIEYWRGVLKPGVFLWVVTIDNQICGSIQLHLAPQQNASHRAEVAKVMVHSSKRRNGIARALMNTLEQRAHTEGRSLLVLDTRAGDPSNLLYQSLGYVEAGTIPSYAKSTSGSFDATTFYYKQI